MQSDLQSQALSRRSFLVATGAFGVAVAFGSSRDAASAASSFTPNAWVTIGDDNIVTIVPPAVEMGQGVRTSLPLILAEDLDVEWSKVRVAETPDDDTIYGNPAFNHQLTTVGSFAVTGYYDVLRQAGAQARKVLIANAATAWKVPADELTTEPGMVVHAKSKRKISYGDLAKTATVPNPLPEVTKADLKPNSQFRLIGKDTGRIDVPSKVNGTAQYGIDTELPDMLYAAVLFPPVQYEGPDQIDDAAAKAVKGVVKIVPLQPGPGVIGGVGVIAETIDAAMRAKTLLKVTWTKKAQAQNYDDDRVLAGLPRDRGGLEQAGCRNDQRRRRRRRHQERRQGHLGRLPVRPRLPCVHGAVERHREGRQRHHRHLVRQSIAEHDENPRHDRRQDDARQGPRPHQAAGRRFRPAHRRRRHGPGPDPGAQRARQTGEDDLEPRGRHPQRQAAAVDRAAHRDRARCSKQYRRLAAPHRQRVRTSRASCRPICLPRSRRTSCLAAAAK